MKLKIDIKNNEVEFVEKDLLDRLMKLSLIILCFEIKVIVWTITGVPWKRLNCQEIKYEI